MPNDPITEAGKRLAHSLSGQPQINQPFLGGCIRDIEDEALTAYRVRLRERVESMEWFVGRTPILALIDEEASRAE